MPDARECQAEATAVWLECPPAPDPLHFVCGWLAPLGGTVTVFAVGALSPSFMPMARSRSPLHIGPTKLLSLNDTSYTSSRSRRHQPQEPARTDRNSTVIMLDDSLNTRIEGDRRPAICGAVPSRSTVVRSAGSI